MKIAALILGIIGGIAGLLGATFALFVGGVGATFGAKDGGEIMWLGFSSLLLSLIGIIGGALGIAKPKAAGYMMLIAGIGGFIAVSAAYIVGGPLLIVGGILALIAAKKSPEAVVIQ